MIEGLAEPMNFQADTLHLAINITDRYLIKLCTEKLSGWPELGTMVVAACLIAGKYNENHEVKPTVSTLIGLLDISIRDEVKY